MTIAFDGTRQAAADVAEAVCQWFKSHKSGTLHLNGVPFEMKDIAMCSEFVRECNFAATGHNEAGHYFGGTAKATEQMLRKEGKQIVEGVAGRGDIVCFNRQAGEYGHIGLVIDGTYYAENTSSTKRGPGFVLSAFSAIGLSRITGFYRLLPSRTKVAAPHDPPLLVNTAQRVVCEGEMVSGTLWTPTRETLAAVGVGVKWDAEQRKAYIV